MKCINTIIRKRRQILLAVLLLIVIATIVPKVREEGGKRSRNLYAYQAEAFLKGRLYIDNTVQLSDISTYNGRKYVAFPPFPAVVLMPFVALLGVTATRVTLIGVALTIVNVFMLNRILKRLKVEPETIPWLLAAFFLGTGYWLCIRESCSVWYFAHMVAVTCLLLAIDSLVGKRRCFLAGMFLGMAFLSRQLSLWAMPFLAVLLWQHSLSTTRKDKIKGLITFACPLLCAIVIYMAMNWVRFGSPLDTGYSYMPLRGFIGERVSKYGLFHPAYFLFNFVHMFLQGPRITFAPPAYLMIDGTGVDLFGTSITLASPFVFVAIKAKWRKELLWGAWISISLALIHAMLYYSNGWGQVNTQRYTLDFMPILILLIALGTRHVRPWVWKMAIAYSVILNVIFHFGIPVVKIAQDIIT